MAMDRRTLLKLGAGTGAAVAVPAGFQINWSSNDFTRPDFQPDAPDAPEGRKVWRNWSGLNVATPVDIFSPADEADLAQRLASHQGKLRPVGSGHSFTALVPNEDMIVDISRLSGLYRHDPVAKTATFGAGTRLRQAAIMAGKVGMAFPNMPDIDVQTLAGAFSTATHGTGRDLFAVHDQIVGLRLVTASGEIMNVSPTENAELLEAAKVSLGALGVITEYTLKMADNYALTKTITLEPIGDVIDSAYDRARQHRNFEFLALPNTGFAAVLVHDIYDGPLTGRPPSQDEDILTALKDLRDVFGWWPWLRRKAFGSYVSAFVPDEGPVEQSTAEYWKLLSTVRSSKFNEMEFHVPEENGAAAVRDIYAIMDARKDAYYPIEFRFTGQDAAWLSPFNDGVRCSVAVHAPADEAYSFMFEVIEPVMRKYGGRPHWGKLHSLGHADFEQLYPKFGEFTAIRQQLDPSGKLLNDHLGKIFGTS